jgi:hypothetical protein
MLFKIEKTEYFNGRTMNVFSVNLILLDQLKKNMMVLILGQVKKKNISRIILRPTLRLYVILKERKYL